jgi:hypothetical protein
MFSGCLFPTSAYFAYFCTAVRILFVLLLLALILILILILAALNPTPWTWDVSRRKNPGDRGLPE